MAGAGGVRVSVAFNQGALDVTPTWTDLTAVSSNTVAGYSIHRGREFELDYTDTGEYSVRLYDHSGLLDPTNSGGAYYGWLEPDLQIKVDLWNPVSSSWHTRFRGWIEDYDYEMDVSQRVQTLTLGCYDIFALLSTIEMLPGAFGDSPPPASAGNVYLNNNTFQDRIENVLGQAGIPDELFQVFTGNVNLLPTVYAPGDTPMNVIQDALDAEFPGVSNAYVDRYGRLACHGRLAKFDPVGTAASAGTDAWDFHAWKIGDAAAIVGDANTVQMRDPYSWNRGRSRIINSALCYPQSVLVSGTTYRDFSDHSHTSEMAAAVVTDPTSIGIRGYASWSRENVQIDNGILTGNTGPEECRLFSTYYVANYAEPRNRVTALTVKSIGALDSRATMVWDFLCNADIADTVALTVTHPGGGGFNAEPFYIEGITETAEPLNGSYAAVTVSLDVSPAAYFDNPEGLDES